MKCFKCKAVLVEIETTETEWVQLPKRNFKAGGGIEHTTYRCRVCNKLRAVRAGYSRV